MDEEHMIAWQDVLDEVAAGRMGNLSCPYCQTSPLIVEQTETMKISCPSCKKFIEGRMG